MPEHPIALKLRRDIVPYLVSSDKLSAQPVYLAYTAYTFLGDLFAAFAGVGLSSPLMDALLGKGEHNAGYPSWLTPMSAVVVALWAFLKFFATSRDGAKRATLMRSCRREVQRLRAKLMLVLSGASPMAALEVMQSDIAALVDRHIAEGSWPFSPVERGADAQASTEVEALVAKFGSGWEQAPSGDRAEAPPPAALSAAQPPGATIAGGPHA